MNFFKSLQMNGVDVLCLERNLNLFGLGLDVNSSKPPFRNATPEGAAFNIIRGIEFFKSLFWKYEIVNMNLLAERTDYRIPLLLPLQYINEPNAKDEKLVRDCLRYIGQPNAGSVSIQALVKATGRRPVAGAENTRIDVDGLLRAAGVPLSDPIPLKKATEASEVTGSGVKHMTEMALLKPYYENLLQREQGNMTRVATLAGVKRTTLYQKLKDFGIKPSEYRHN
jgi:DNA-binding protein Fis